MCGIVLCLADEATLPCKLLYLNRYIVPSVRQRGPTAQADLAVDIQNNTIGNGRLWLYSSVLSLRDPFTPQPIDHGSGILQFNGELYNDNLIGNDTQWVITQFEKQGVLSAIEGFRGEFAFTYYDKMARKIWFGRDCVGRRSLMYQYDPTVKDGLIVSSLGPQDDPDFDLNEQGIWKEVTGGNIMCLDLDTMIIDSIPFSYQATLPKSEKLSLAYPYPSINNADSTIETLTPVLANDLYNLLHLAVKRRVLTEPHVPISVLFSGGIDCTLLAHLVDCIIPQGETIDLFNVAFENLRTGSGYDTPDRKLGKRSWFELEQIYQNRQRKKEVNENKNGKANPKIKPRFRFVEVNVPYNDMSAAKSTVQTLMYPKDSVMDLSIAIAFYFASRGQGVSYVNASDSTSPPLLGLECGDFKSPSPVLISGLGADELFGGYTRHTTTLSRSGYKGLAEELQMDFNRLHERNLGRDDRVCACWGKEVRYPFLDEDVIAWALGQCPLDLKVRDMMEEMLAAERVIAEKIQIEVEVTEEKFLRLETESMAQSSELLVTKELDNLSLESPSVNNPSNDDLPQKDQLRAKFKKVKTKKVKTPKKLNREDYLHTKYVLRLVAESIGLHQVSKEKKRAIQFGAKSAKMEVGTGKIKGTDRL